MKWTNDSALIEIDSLINSIDSLKNVEAFSADHVYWHQKVVSFLEDIFGKESRYFQGFSHLSWRRDGSFLVGGIGDPDGSYNPQAAIEREHHKGYQAHLGTARGILLAARDQIQHNELGDVYRGKDTGPEASLLLKVINLAEFKFRKVFRNPPDNERVVQDNFENLLIGADLPYSRETESIEYSTKTYTPDFSIFKADLAIEMKICSKSGREKEIIPEINDDILAYKTKFGNIIFIVYDLGFIRDVERFVSNFQDQENVIVKVVKH